MEWAEEHVVAPDASFDGGNLDCGNGLLLLIRRHIDPLHKGGILEILSSETSVAEDLPAWCRMTGNEFLSGVRGAERNSYLVCKGSLSQRNAERPQPSVAVVVSSEITAAKTSKLDVSELVPKLEGLQRPFVVTGVGSWPRPKWMLLALEEFLKGRMAASDFHEIADDAVRQIVQAQEQAGVDLVTDGEQRRDNYASFVGSRLENCQLVPITDLLPYVDDPDKFAKELQALDVPADTVRHPAVFGRLERKQPLTVHELAFVRQMTQKPIKIALPGPYLLTRTMWLECVSEKVYQEREDLAEDIVRILREEIQDLLHQSAALVQVDEPVLTEVVFGRPEKNRSFMCGALGERRDSESELEFASSLLQRVFEGFPRERLAMHICRGNWSRDEGVALQGDYTPLIPLLNEIPVGTFFLEMCTPRAGDVAILQGLPQHCKVGLGVVNPKSADVEPSQQIYARAKQLADLIGPERLWLNPDCGFATFANSPIAPLDLARNKMAAIVEAANQLRKDYFGTN